MDSEHVFQDKNLLAGNVYTNIYILFYIHMYYNLKLLQFHYFKLF